VNSLIIAWTNFRRSGRLDWSSELLLPLSAKPGLKPDECLFAQAKCPRKCIATTAYVLIFLEALATLVLNVGCYPRVVTVRLIEPPPDDGILVDAVRLAGRSRIVTARSLNRMPFLGRALIV